MLPCLYIDLNAVAYNYGLCKSFVTSAKTAAVIKNNAYGLGTKEISKKLYEEKGCRYFFVAYADEAVSVRSVAPEATIYLLKGFDIKYGGLRGGYISFIYYKFDAPSNDGKHDSGEFEVLSYPNRPGPVDVKGIKIKIVDAKTDSLDYMILPN